MYWRFRHIISLQALLIFGFAMYSCKPKKQEIPPTINVNLEVRDNKQQPVIEATAYLYATQEAFDGAFARSQRGIYTNAGASYTGKVINGKLVFHQIPSNQEYWILVVDRSSFFVDKSTGATTEHRIYKDNTEAYYYISSFQNGTEVFANITLQPVNSLIKFSGDGSSQTFAYKDIQRSYNAVDDIAGYVEVRKGLVPYMLRTQDCVWTGEVNAIGGEIVSEELVACNEVRYTFQADAGNFTGGGEIHIFIGQNATQPSLVLSDASPKSILLAPSQGSEYTYIAKHTKQNCVWQKKASPTQINILPLCE